MPSEIAAANIVLTPLLNDWDACAIMLRSLDAELASAGRSAHVLMVDDGSSLEPPAGAFAGPWAGVTGVGRLVLRRNLGHQRAIAIGMAWLLEHAVFERLIVMDADGEDVPADVPRLLRRCLELDDAKIIFAERTKRSEGMAFSLMYWLFRQSHLVLTGVPVRVGNFSVVPRERAESLSVVSDMWNHYAASVVRARVPHARIPTARGRRASGRSKMNLVTLIIHGLSAMSVFGDIAGVRMLLASVAATCVALCLAAWTQLTESGRPMLPMALVLLVLSAQGVGLSLFFVFSTLASRKGAGFVPRRDHGMFVARFEAIATLRAGPSA